MSAAVLGRARRGRCCQLGPDRQKAVAQRMLLCAGSRELLGLDHTDPTGLVGSRENPTGKVVLGWTRAVGGRPGGARPGEESWLGPLWAGVGQREVAVLWNERAELG